MKKIALIIVIVIGGMATELTNMVSAEDIIDIAEVEQGVENAEVPLESTAVDAEEAILTKNEGIVGVVKSESRNVLPRAIVKNGTVGTVDWTLDDVGVLTFSGGTFPDYYNWQTFGNLTKDDTKTVNFTAPITAGNSLDFMFQRYMNLTTINGLNNLDTNNVTSMSFMFSECGLTELDLSSFNTSNVTKMDGMLQNCQNLTKLDLSNFDTTKTQFPGLYGAFMDMPNLKELKLGAKSLFLNGAGNASAFSTNPLNNEKYTGKWECVETGELFTLNEIYHVAGKAGTYIWEVRKYNVNYDSKGGSTVPLALVKYDEKATEPTEPKKSGYVFDGWYADENYTNIWDFTKNIIQGDVTLYAKWKESVIVTNQAPIINAVDHVLKVGDNFNPLSGVSAIDNEDGVIILTTANVISNNVDTSKVGKYEVTYMVADSGGLTVTKTIIVEVVGDAAVIEPKINAPIQTGDNSTIGIYIVTLLGSIGVLLKLKKKSKINLK